MFAKGVDSESWSVLINFQVTQLSFEILVPSKHLAAPQDSLS